MRVYYPVLLQHSLYIQNLFRAGRVYMGHETLSVKQNDTGRYCMELQQEESNPHSAVLVHPCLRIRLSVNLTPALRLVALTPLANI